MKAIVGAGLAGLLAAHAWPHARVFEAMERPRATHRALLRFRSASVARLTGIDFRRVQVRKGIWSEGDFRAPSIRLANLYARKVLREDRLTGERSIWNVEPVERFIAPDTLYEQLIDAVRDRIEWGTAFTPPAGSVSTIPMPSLLALLGIEHSIQFVRAPITVFRFSIPRADIFQTVYFPDHDTSIYRVSITGNTLIAEFAAQTEALHGSDLFMIEQAFGIDASNLVCREMVEQRFGKIEPIADDERKSLLFRITHEHGVYSLGRFATWRNILLDDVIDDIVAIKRLARAAPYEIRMENSK